MNMGNSVIGIPNLPAIYIMMDYEYKTIPNREYQNLRSKVQLTYVYGYVDKLKHTFHN